MVLRCISLVRALTLPSAAVAELLVYRNDVDTVADESNGS